jgi:hypothetical protein
VHKVCRHVIQRKEAVAGAGELRGLRAGVSVRARPTQNCVFRFQRFHQMMGTLDVCPKPVLVNHRVSSNQIGLKIGN